MTPDTAMGEMVMRPTTKSVFRVACSVCKTTFTTTLKKTIVEPTRLHRKTRYGEPGFATGASTFLTFEKAERRFGICPNCGHSEMIGIIPLGKTIEIEEKGTSLWDALTHDGWG